MMSRLSQRAGKNRLAVFAGITGVIGLAWLFLGDRHADLIHEERVTATIVETILGGGSADSAQGVGIVVVELPDGGRARVFAPRKQSAVGTALSVTVKQYADGRRVVTAAGPSEPASTTQ